MIITITWTNFITSLTIWYLLRYLYFAWIKYNSGASEPFNPFIEYSVSNPVRSWENGYLRGKARIIREFGLEDQCDDQEVLELLARFRETRKPS